ncbi:MAG: type II toxin-antitoxin system HicA family toxin [Oscillospiraceae bacterium]|nr:type II toxin-antitoxin system HicA family toxin [Oscillospiraceae bacterium]
MAKTSKQMLKFVIENGCREVRQRGSHIFIEHTETGKTTVIPMHCKDLGKGLEQKILKDLGLK